MRSWEWCGPGVNYVFVDAFFCCAWLTLVKPTTRAGVTILLVFVEGCGSRVALMLAITVVEDKTMGTLSMNFARWTPFVGFLSISLRVWWRCATTVAFAA